MKFKDLWNSWYAESDSASAIIADSLIDTLCGVPGSFLYPDSAQAPIWIKKNNSITSSLFYDAIDKKLLSDLGAKPLRTMYAVRADENDSQEQKKLATANFVRISAILYAHSYKLDTLYESLFYDYDPITNYDRTEKNVRSIQRDYGERNSVRNADAYSDKTEQGAYSDKVNRAPVTSTQKDAAYSDTTDYGEQKSTLKKGAYSDDITNKVATFDSATNINRDSTTNARSSATDENVQNGYSNTTDYGDKTTTYTNGEENTTNSYGEKASTFSGGARKEKTTDSAHADSEVEESNLTVRGNIGSMTTQQMIREQRQLATFVFADAIADILRKEIMEMEWDI